MRIIIDQTGKTHAVEDGYGYDQQGTSGPEPRNAEITSGPALGADVRPGGQVTLTEGAAGACTEQGGPGGSVTSSGDTEELSAESMTFSGAVETYYANREIMEQFVKRARDDAWLLARQRHMEWLRSGCAYNLHSFAPELARGPEAFVLPSPWKAAVGVIPMLRFIPGAKPLSKFKWKSEITYGQAV